MNYYGSYRHLVRNAKAAMIAAIEIYNKPKMEYREECCVILLLNAWELLLKGLLSKNKQSIYYPKKRGQPYRTLSWSDAANRAKAYCPKQVPFLAVRRNLDLLGTYRDNSIHFYNQKAFGVVLYALAQTSIVNFRDVLRHAFAMELGDDINWHLLPLGVDLPIDPIEYIRRAGDKKETSAAVRQFLTELQAAAGEVHNAGVDTGRLCTVFKVKLESTKKIEQADVVVGVKKADESGGPLAVVRAVDPNVSYPWRETEIVAEIDTLHGRAFTNYVFRAIVWKYKLQDRQDFCWKAREGTLIRYSREVVAWIRQLSAADVEAALTDYRAYIAKRKKAKRAAGKTR